MIDLALAPSDTRPTRKPDAPTARGFNLRGVLLAAAAAGAVCGFGVAASTLMAGLAAPPRVMAVAAGRAADWPDLKDGLPVLAGTSTATQQAPKAAEPAIPPLRMAAMPDPAADLPPAAMPAPAAARPAEVPPEPPTKRIPTPTPVALIGPARQAVILAPARMAALQPPRASETVRARDVVEPVAAPVVTHPPAMPAAAASAPVASPPDKPQRKAVAARKASATAKAGDKPGAASAAVAQSEASEPEETEVLGIKLPSLAPAGRKLKEGVDALGDAVKNVF